MAGLIAFGRRVGIFALIVPKEALEGISTRLVKRCSGLELNSNSSRLVTREGQY